MARPTHPTACGLLGGCAAIVASRSRGAPLTRADVATLRATIRLLSSMNASRSPAAWALRLEHESVRRPPIPARPS
jgi:hypothetical protein